MLELSDDQRAQVQTLLRRHVPGREVRAFGSRTGKGRRFKPHSDLDLLILGAAPLDDVSRSNLREALDESDLPFRVDILEWVDAPESLRLQALEHGHLLQRPD